MQPVSTPGLGERLSGVAAWPARLVFRLLEPAMAGMQRLIGVGRMPYLFVLPNLLFFGVFVVLPLFINLAFSMTGGSNLFLSDRPYVGFEQ
jgi:alpha-1,4-digalacturonate transport system permease protein